MSATIRIAADAGQINETPILRAELTIEQEIITERFAQLSEPDLRWEPFITRYNVTKQFPGLKSWRAEVDLDAAELIDGEVIAHFIAGEREWFGRGYVAGFTLDPYATRLTVHGMGDLGERASTRSATART